jgi:ribonuclease P protein component
VAFNRLGTLKYLTKQGPFAVVVSSKHEKRAVARNKLRRRLYSLFKQKDPQISGILYVSKGVYKAEYPELTTLFHELLTKASK